MARAAEARTRHIGAEGFRRDGEQRRRARLAIGHAGEVGLRRLVRRKLHGLFVLSVLGLRWERDFAAPVGDDLVGVERDAGIGAGVSVLSECGLGQVRSHGGFFTGAR
jgi:hypothetical protein